MRISDETSEKISFWSFVFSLLVVVIHCAWKPETEVERLTFALVRTTLARMAVPFFFACSGYFLARHFDEFGWWRREIGKRLRSLGVPYVLWTLVYAVVLFVEAGELMGLGGFGLNPCKPPALAALWYVRSLMVFVILSPVFKVVLDRWKGWTLLAAYGVMTGWMAVSHLCRIDVEAGLGGFLFYGFPVVGLFYFLCGMYGQRFHWRFWPRRTCGWILLSGLALIALWLLTVHLNVQTGGVHLCLVTPLVLVGVMGFMRTPTLPVFLRCCAFPIYLIHGVVLAVLRYWNVPYHVCNPWLELALCVAVPVVFCNLMRRLAPCASAVLFGGRT